MARMLPFAALRGKMQECGVDQHDLAYAYNRKYGTHHNNCYFSARFRGAVEWTITDAYFVLDYLGIQNSEFCKYFPLGGFAA